MPILFNLARYRKPGDIFTEVGTGWGCGVDDALNAGFERVDTCEVNKQRFKFIEEVYRGDPRVVACHDIGKNFMRRIMREDRGSRRVWWLDTKADDGGTTKVPQEATTLRELQILILRERCGDTVMINNVDRFGKRGWGKKTKLKNVLEDLHKLFKPAVVLRKTNYRKDDVIVAFQEGTYDFG